MADFDRQAPNDETGLPHKLADRADAAVGRAALRKTHKPLRSGFGKNVIPSSNYYSA